jgi:serine/threonine protein kinase
LSPERLEGSDYNEKADIWALGVLFYQLLTNDEYPFCVQNYSQLKLAKAIEEDEIKKLPDGISSESKHLLYLMLERDPEARPSTMQLLRYPLILDRVR